MISDASQHATNSGIVADESSYILVTFISYKIKLVRVYCSLAEKVCRPLSEEKFSSFSGVDRCTYFTLSVTLEVRLLGEAPATAVGDEVVRHVITDLTRHRDDALGSRLAGRRGRVAR